MIVEANLLGTHDGLAPRPAPDRPHVRDAVCAVFVFEEDRLVCERVYFDSNTILRQLGIARDPVSLSGRLATALTTR